MRLVLVGAALRNYTRPLFVRENQLFFSALMFMAMLGLGYPGAAKIARLHGVRALFIGHHHTIFTFAWFTLTFVLTGCCARQYWRQVTSGIAGIVPGLIVAEYTAILLVFAAVVVILAAPFWELGAPLTGSLALAAIGMIMGGAVGSASPTGQHRVVRALIGMSMLPFFLLAGQPRYLALVMFAPRWLAGLVLLSAVGLIALGLRYFPAQALLQTDTLEIRMDQRVARAARQGQPKGVLAAIQWVWRWQPSFWRAEPAVGNLTLHAGPVGMLLGQIVLTGLLAGFYSILFRIQGDGHHLLSMLRGTLPQSLALGLFAMTRWLLDRGAWPMLFMAGRYGGRLGFANAMFRAHRRNATLMAASAGIVGFVLELSLTPTGVPQALIGALAIGGVIFGMSYATATPLFWHELGGKGFTAFFQIAGFMVATFTIELGIFFHGLKLFVLPVALGAVIFGLVTGRVAARRLAAMDWPLESDAAG